MAKFKVSFHNKLRKPEIYDITAYQVEKPNLHLVLTEDPENLVTFLLENVSSYGIVQQGDADEEDVTGSTTKD